MPDRTALLNELNDISFVMNDVTLYLDTHPLDEQALELFEQSKNRRKQLMQEYEQQFEPLTVDCVCVNSHGASQDFCNYPGQRHFTWVDGPTPWEGGHI
ncbi:spore coat protein CotJB [Lactonifactor longoviformis]|uniref:Spore coat protein JB n=1 Tax=Lactonifactor longoviformis DSM 17459 TaxID=1122155 RepID=A0A1M5CFK7_9CLOT|nr:spore coat protein CotJB [Lactonifactor longoviformis]POP31725.1 spore coat protein CotJB [Lactonifactor longoviformis]SHF53202.1 spore coat protein JB [Lactonifactor longoviformis DSM 17459]